ncbi:Sec24 [Hexamita inflata]|uniref:Sec24 n=1 Tax=Hexamita inflata TaxID=28002 RepID=A0AA86QN39_9EUKA|nr:Sec24 [Hexamita inflata]
MSQRRRYPALPSNQQAQQDQNQPQVENMPPQNTNSYSIPVIETQEEQQSFHQQPVVQQQIQQNNTNNSTVQQTPYYQEQQNTYAAQQMNQIPTQAEQLPKFQQSNIMQFTHGMFPVSNGELQHFKMPTGLIITPHLEEQMPTIDFNTELRLNPPRCANCKGFVSCYSQFTDQGRHICPLCNMESQLDFEYERLMRIPEQHQLRPELQNEAYEVVAPDIYRVRRTETFETLSFVIDISNHAISSGLVRNAAQIILEQLTELKNAEVRTMVSILLVNTQLHYFVFRNAENFEILTVPDVDSNYIPAPRDVIVALKSRGDPIFAILQNLEQIAKSIPAVVSTKNSFTHSSSDLAFYSAVESAYKCMQNVGGRILYFISQIPSAGEGSLHEKLEARKQSGKSVAIPDAAAVKEALTGANEKYTDLGVKCALSHVSVDGIVATFSEFCDLATLHELSRPCAGNIKHLPEYDERRDYELLKQYVVESVGLNNYLEGCVRLRMSRQAEVKYFYGQGQFGSQNLVNLAHIQPGTTIGAEIQMTDLCRMGQYMYFQLSYLYTAKTNIRYVRVITKRVKCESTLNFFQSINVQPLIALFAKKASFAIRKNTDISAPVCAVVSLDATRAVATASLSSQQPFETVNNALYGAIFATLSYYCKLTSFTQIQQFPAKFQEFICYAFAVTKMSCVRPIGSKVFIDERASFMGRIERASVEEAINLIYPMCLDINGNRTRLSADMFSQEQIYLIGGPYQVLVFIGANVDLQIIQQLTVGKKVNLQGLIELNLQEDNEIVHNMNQQIRAIQAACKYNLPVVCVSGQGRLTGPIFACLIESRIDGPSFADFTKQLSANLQNIK